MKGKLSDWIAAFIIGVISGIASWILIEFWKDEQAMKHIISFLITFSPVFIGLFAFFIYWLVQDYRKIRRQIYDPQELINKVKFQIFNQMSTRLDYLEKKIKLKEPSWDKAENIQEIIDDVIKKIK